jgi:GT2 family glycosyltransferase
MGTSSVIVGILTYNGLSYLPRCLSSLAEQSMKDFDLVILDNASSDGTVRYLRERKLERCQLWVNTKNTGFTGGYNLIFSRVRSQYKYLVLLNQDTILHESWLAELVHAAEASKWSLVSSNVRDLTDLHNSSFVCRPVWFLHDWGALVYGDITYVPTRSNFVAGTACLVNMENLREQAYLFDERLFMYHEDVDLSIRLAAYGHKLGIAPRALAWHDNSVEPWVVFYVVRNLHWVLRKNFGLRFYLAFLGRTIRWTAKAAVNIARRSQMGYFARGTVAGIKGVFLLDNHVLSRSQVANYNAATPPHTRKMLEQRLRSGKKQDLIFHA